MLVDDERELRGEPGEDPESHDVHGGHDPRVGVGEDVELLADVRLDRNVFEQREGEDRRHDRPGDEEDGRVVHVDGAV